MNIYPFIVLTGMIHTKPSIRVNINSICDYGDVEGVTHINYSHNHGSKNYIRVKETPEEIDELIDGLNEPTIFNQTVE